MTQSTKRWLSVLALAGAALATEPTPAKAYNINWNNHSSWQWFSNEPGSTTPLDWSPTCMDGSPTGLGVYVPTNWGQNQNKKVMYWFDGGGACWDDQTCNHNTPPTLTAPFTGIAAPFVFRKHFNRNDFQTYISTPPAGTFDVNGMIQTKATLAQGIFDHSAGTTNPFKDYLQVFVPYCTGDMHVGYKNDTTDSAFRKHSGVNFTGLTNSYFAVAYTDYFVRQHLGTAPPMSVVTGGSAGGFGALMLYGLIRMSVPPDEKIVTISDSGPPFPTGVPNASGTSWTSQGYMGLPTPRTGCSASSYNTVNGPRCAEPSTVTYQEALMADAWSTQWSLYGDPTFAAPTTPAGSPGPLMSIAARVRSQINNTVGDKFYIIAGNNDFLAPVFFSMYPNGTVGQTATVGSGEAQFISTLPSPSIFHQVTTDESGLGTFAGAVPWNRHHGFLMNDTSTWDSTKTAGFFPPGHGSGVLQWLNSIGGW